MGPPKAALTISQQAFDEMVRENIDDLGMEPAEALQDAIETLKLQGVDLNGKEWKSDSIPIIQLIYCIQYLHFTCFMQVL